MLVEDGVLGLDDPVDPWLPEPANRSVLRRIDVPLDDTVPAERAITLRDLALRIDPVSRRRFGCRGGFATAFLCVQATDTVADHFNPSVEAKE